MKLEQSQLEVLFYKGIAMFLLYIYITFIFILSSEMESCHIAHAGLEILDLPYPPE